jgi:hypothetical protein
MSYGKQSLPTTLASYSKYCLVEIRVVFGWVIGIISKARDFRSSGTCIDEHCSSKSVVTPAFKILTPLAYSE